MELYTHDNVLLRKILYFVGDMGLLILFTCFHD
jgi:hypothetical protein